MLDGIRNGFPPIDGSDLDPELDAWFRDLPENYRAFLQAHNGGFVDDFRYTFLSGVPFKTETEDSPSRNDCPVEFYGLGTTEEPGEFPADLLSRAREHHAEDFLPRGVIAIARCVQGSLVCISLRDYTFGEMFYWESYWRYPYCKHFFDARLAEVTKDYDDVPGILRDEEHPQHAELFDRLNFATLTHLAPTFSAWLASCEDKSGA